MAGTLPKNTYPYKGFINRSSSSDITSIYDYARAMKKNIAQKRVLSHAAKAALCDAYV